MAITLNNTIQMVRFRLSSGPVGEFLKWWGEALRDAMPSRLRERMQYARRKLLIQMQDGEIVFSIDNARTIQALDVVSAEQDLQLQQQRIREIVQQHELDEVGRDLLLSEDVVLRTSVTMPLATESNLAQALAYEMDRNTPFRADEVFFGWRGLTRDRENSQLRLELYVTPREGVIAQVEQLKRLGMAPTGVDINSADGPLGMNLLPEAMRFHIVNQQVRLNWMLAAATVFLLVFAMAQSLWLREHQVEAINGAIDNVRAEAQAVQQIRKQIDDASEAAGFLQVRKIDNGYKVELLAELTRILPDDTYLDRLSMHEGTVQMQGKSGNAQSLIELVNASPIFENASFRGPTRLDNRSGKEIFDLTADVTKMGGA